MSDLLADAMNEHLNSLSYAAIGGRGFSAQASQSGITLQFSGYHQSVIPLVTKFSIVPIPLIDELTGHGSDN